MLLRRAIPLAFVVAIACEPSVPYNPGANNPTSVDYAVFDPAPDPVDNSPADIPLPSDVALQPQALATQSGAQLEVLQSFAAQGGWPADQDLPITFDFVRINIDPTTGKGTRTAPALDLSTINPSTVVVLSASTAGVGAVAYDPIVSNSYRVNGDHGTLTLNKTPDPNDPLHLRHWSPGTYIAAVRGGPNGVKVNGGGQLYQRPAMYLITQGVDLSVPENQGLLPGNTREEKAQNAALLEQLRKSLLQPFGILKQAAGMDPTEIASIAVFTVPNRVRVEADPVAALAGSSSALPFPSDFLFKPGTHTLLDALTAPTGPFGPLGPGLGTLDGFSTTALMTVNTTGAGSGLIDPKTVNKDSVFLYEYVGTSVKRIAEIGEGPAAHPGWAAASSTLASFAGLQTINIIGLQPAIPVQLPDGSVFPLPPLDDGSEYAVVITDKVKDAGGTPIVQATVGRLLSLNNSLLSNGTPTVAGLDPANAQLLEPLRVALKPVLDDLAASKGITRDHVTMAYTVRTQSGIKTTATLLSALPYSTPSSGPTSTIVPLQDATLYCGPAIPGCPSTTLITGQMSAYGVDPTVTPNSSIGFLLEASVLTFNKLECPPASDTSAGGAAACATANAANGGKPTGAFTPPNIDPAPEPITALIAAPYPGTPAVGGCIPGPAAAGGNSANGVCTVPLVVFRHGLNSSRSAMLRVANELTKAGFVVAAIDASKHGDRSFCQASAQCASGGTCTPVPALTNEGDAPGPTPGKCSNDFLRDTSCSTCANTKSTPIASGNYIFSFNLFRSRDTFRQDIIDESQLIRLLSPNPGCDKTAPPTDPAHSCASFVLTGTAAGAPLTGFQIDPQKIYFAGSSLGGIQGVVDAAANPRVKRVALNVAGGTLVDIATNGNIKDQLNLLLASRGLDKASNPSGYLQFINTAKWVLDPADPLNFAQHLITSTLAFPDPTLNALAPAPASRPTMGQMALCDPTVPNPFNLELYNLLGLPSQTATASMTTFTSHAAPVEACPTGGGVNHGFLTDWVTYGASITPQAQDDIAAFFADTATVPPPLRQAP